jgi:hypothetical protein
VVHVLSDELCEIAVALPVTLQWIAPQKKKKHSAKEMYLEEVTGLSVGHKTPAFWAQASHRGLSALPTADLCFSLIADERTVCEGARVSL